ncbi:MAG: hypothetical protein WBF33_06930 [Candidatus Nitrosopolaris sp.]
MISVGKNHRPTTALVVIAALASVLIINAVPVGSGHICIST